MPQRRALREWISGCQYRGFRICRRWDHCGVTPVCSSRGPGRWGPSCLQQHPSQEPILSGRASHPYHISQPLLLRLPEVASQINPAPLNPLRVGFWRNPTGRNREAQSTVGRWVPVSSRALLLWIRDAGLGQSWTAVEKTDQGWLMILQDTSLFTFLE